MKKIILLFLLFIICSPAIAFQVIDNPECAGCKSLVENGIITKTIDAYGNVIYDRNVDNPYIRQEAENNENMAKFGNALRNLSAGIKEQQRYNDYKNMMILNSINQNQNRTIHTHCYNVGNDRYCDSY
jgi:hypothetical protein